MITSPNVSATPTCPSWCVFASTITAPAPAKTSANVPIASATSALVSLVPDAAHLLEALAGGVVELPVLVPFSGIDRAGVAAPHRDHHVGRADDLVRQRLRELLAQVDADL